MFKFIGKIIIVLILIGLVVWGIIVYFPGLREKGESAYRQFGGWTEEARRSNPVGFIDHAMDRLQEDLKAMETSQLRLSEVSADLKLRLERTRQLERQAGQLAGEFRAAYRQAEDGAGYPVRISGQNYSREALRDQVELLLNQRRQYEQLIQELEASQARIEERQQQLVLQIPETRAALEMLPAKREIARVEEITGGTRQLLEEVNAVMNTNQEVLEKSPVRTVEELLNYQETGGDASSMSVDPDEVTRFLEGAE